MFLVGNLPKASTDKVLHYILYSGFYLQGPNLCLLSTQPYIILGVSYVALWLVVSYVIKVQIFSESLVVVPSLNS